MSENLLEEIVNLSQTKTQNSRKLYMAVLDVVKSFPNRYFDFISVLEEEDTLYTDLLTVLRESYHLVGMFKSRCLNKTLADHMCQL